MSRRCILLLWCFVAFFAGTPPPAMATKTTAEELKGKRTGKPLKELLPVELTSKNFGSHVSDGNIWFIEFYAPWCSHCNSFRVVWEGIATHYHDRPDKKIRIGKIDGDSERALTSRFNVQAYPSFYLIDGYTVYKYEKSRNEDQLKAFAEGGYRKKSAIPFFASPMGPLGLCQGAFLHVAYGTFHIIDWLQSNMGLSPFLALMLLFGGAFVGTFVAIVVATIAFTPKEKQN